MLAFSPARAAPNVAAMGALAISTAFSTTLDTDEAGWDGYTTRSVTLVANAAGGTQICVTFEAPASGTMNCNNASIGVSNGTASQTTATPVELLFSGISGFSIANGATITSDWATLTTTTSDKMVVVIDHGASSAARKKLTGGSDFYKAATASYNSANPTGMTADQGDYIGFNKIEVR